MREMQILNVHFITIADLLTLSNLSNTCMKRVFSEIAERPLHHRLHRGEQETVIFSQNECTSFQVMLSSTTAAHVIILPN